MTRFIRDYEIPYGSFEPPRPLAAYSPLAMMSLMTSPLGWWVNAACMAYGAWSEAMVRAMVYPCELPPTHVAPGMPHKQAGRLAVGGSSQS
jgi:hypothetical protein